MRTWYYITDRDSARKAFRVINKYCLQSYKDGFGQTVDPVLAYDLETFRPDADPNKFPRAIWNGEEWEGDIRIAAVGLDPLNSEFAIRDKQFLFDVQALGHEFVAAGLKESLENFTVLSQRQKYEYEFSDALLDIQIRYRIDTLLINQAIKAGDRMKSDLGELYSEYVLPSVMRDHLMREGRTFNVSDQDHSVDPYLIFKRYKAYKKRMQGTYWGGRLTREMLQYSADDVRFIFYVLEEQYSQIDQHVARFEKNFPKHKSLEGRLKLEFSLIPIFARATQTGLRFDVERHQNEIIPLLDSKREQAFNKLLEFPEVWRQIPKNTTWLMFKSLEQDALDKYEGLTAGLKKLIVRYLGKGNIKSISVKGTRPKAGHEVFVSVTGRFDPKVLYAICRKRLPKDKWHYHRQDIVNFNSPAQALKVLREATGIKNLKNTDADYLESVCDPDNPKTDILKYYARYKTAETYSVKYGRGLLAHISKRGYIHPEWNQMGGEFDEEIATGRSSAFDPPIMQWPFRDTLFAWDGDPGIPAADIARDLVIAAPGNIFINVDKSQIEPRITAMITGDKKMRRIFKEGRDQHKETARLIFELDDDEEVTESQRGEGKQTNLGMQYGMGYKKLADGVKRKTKGRVDWTTNNYKRAKEVVKLYDEGYEGLTRAKDKIEAQLCRRPYQAGSLAPWKISNAGKREPFYTAINYFGRIRRFGLAPYQEKLPDYVLDENYRPPGYEGFFYNEFHRRLNECSRQAWNFRVQSAAADLLKYAELFVTRALDIAFKDHPKWDRWQHGIKIFLHDELLVEVPEEVVEEAKVIIHREMMRASYLLLDPEIVPAKTNMAVAYSWGECGKLLKAA